METVLLFKKEDKPKIDELLARDEYRELSLTYKDPAVLGFKDEEEGTQYLHLKGDDKLIESFLGDSKQEDGTELLKKAEKEADILGKIHEEEAQANAGVGFIFGN